MSRTVEIESATAERLEAIAKAKNLTVEALLFTYVPGLSPKIETSPASGAEAIRALDEWIADFPQTPPLSDEAISRSSIYGEA
jgi:hypothetical protein